MTAAQDREAVQGARRAAAARAVRRPQPVVVCPAPAEDPSMRGRKRASVLLALALAGATVTVTAVPAAAAWLASRTSTSSVATARFVYGTGTAAPSAPTVTALSNGLRLAFPATTLSGSGRAATGYRVVRTLTSGTSAGSTTVIGCSATAAAGSITCDDLTVPAGVTATYTQQPLYLRWAGATSASSTAASWTAPVVPPGVTVPGTPTLSAPAFANATTSPAITLSGSAAAGSLVTLTVRDRNGRAETFTVTATSAGTYSVTRDLTGFADGALSISATAGNSAGTSAAQTASTFKDVVAPLVAYTATSPLAVTSTFDGTNQTSSATPTLSGTAGAVAAGTSTTADGGTVTVTVRDAAGAAVSTGTPSRTGSPATSWSTTVAAPGLPDAVYTVTATQSDAAGNVGSSAGKSLRIEAKAASASNVLVRNTTGTPKIVDLGDEVVLTYSERINPFTVITGWDGTTQQTLDVTLTHGTNAKDPDKIGPWTVNTGTLVGRAANLGTVDLGAATYFRFTGTAKATLRLETPVTGGSVLVVRFTAYPDGISANSGGNETTVNWTPSPLVTDLAGTPTLTPTPTSNRTTAF